MAMLLVIEAGLKQRSLYYANEQLKCLVRKTITQQNRCVLWQVSLFCMLIKFECCYAIWLLHELFELFEWFNVRQHDNGYIDTAAKKVN